MIESTKIILCVNIIHHVRLLHRISKCHTAILLSLAIKKKFKMLERESVKKGR